MVLATVPLSQYHHLRANLHSIVEIDHVIVGHSYAARRYSRTNGIWLVRSMYSVEARTQVDRTCAERIIYSTRRVTGDTSQRG